VLDGGHEEKARSHVEIDLGRWPESEAHRYLENREIYGHEEKARSHVEIDLGRWPESEAGRYLADREIYEEK